MPGFVQNTLLSAWNKTKRAFTFSSPGGYEALVDRGRRRSMPAITMGEEQHLPEGDRRRLIAGHRALRRNFSIAGWMMRRHMDFVSSFRFQPRTGDHATDKHFTALVNRASRPDRAHVKGRLSLAQLIRMAEGLRTCDGDTGWLKLASRHIQLIEGDRIRNPAVGYVKNDWYNGVRINDAGRPLEYSVYRRIAGGSAFEFERLVNARNMLLHGYMVREDQQRGVSPLASAYNELQDVYEFHGLTLARAKVQSFFGLTFFRDANESVGDVTGEDVDEDGQPLRSTYSVDFGKGPAVLDLDPGDKAQFLESAHPSTSLQDYVTSVLVLALKALDLPMSFLDESWTNFFGSRGAWLLYDRACEPKREENQLLLDDWTTWQCIQWIIDGDLVLPDGVTLDDRPWEWVPRKVPVFRRIEDVKADILALQAGLTTPEGICREDDEGSFVENVNDIADALAYAKSRGVNMVWDVADNGDDTADSEDPEETPKAKGTKDGSRR